MKMKLKTDGLTGDHLNFVNSLNAKFAEMPDAATPEEIQGIINGQFTAATGEKGLFKVAMDAALETITDDTKEGTLAFRLKQQGTQIASLKELGGAQKENTLVEVFEALKEDFISQTKQRTGTMVFDVSLGTEMKRTNREGQVSKGQTIKLQTDGKKFVSKAAGVQTIAGSITNDITAGTALRLGDGPFYEIKRGRPFILDFVSVGETNQPFLIWWDETPKQGDFAITAEGVMKPQVQYEFERKSADYRKVAGYIVLTDEFMNDMPQLVTNIRRLAQIDIMNDLNASVLTDMLASLPSFTYTGLNSRIYHADDYAAIGAAITQIQSLFFQPTVLVLNPADSWKMKLTKDDVGRYQMPPFAFNGETFEFGQVITDPRVPIGNFLVGDGATFNVDFRGGMTIRIGYNGTDFVENQQTLLVEQYFYDYISTNRLGAWVYGNFSVIKGVINDTTNS